MKTFVSITDVTFVCITLLLTVVYSMDLVHVINHPEDYRIAQHFVEDQLSYNSPSVQNYMLREVILILMCVGMSVVVTLKIYDKLNNRWIYLYYAAYVSSIANVVWSYINWSNSGFDH